MDHLGGWAMNWLESRVEDQHGEGQRVWLRMDEVESLRPDASLTMSLPARYLRARQPLAPRRILARIRAMRLKSPRRRCSCTQMQLSAARQLYRPRSSTGIGRSNIIETGALGWSSVAGMRVVIGGSSPRNRRKIAIRRRRKR